MILHFIRIIIIIGSLLACMMLPFMPGAYDGLALTLSYMAQAFGILGLLLVPIGVIWLIYEVKKQAKIHHFATATVVVSSFIAVVLSIVASANVGYSFGVLTFALWLYILSILIPRLKLLKNADRHSFNSLPLYLIMIPITILICQLILAAPATAFSRNQAIANSAELIHDIEQYHKVNGRYPSSLLAVWKDYYPNIMGIEKFHYAPQRAAYNLFFEQPRFLFNNFGTREFVVYNKLDEQTMISHTSWIMLLSPEQLQTTQGWYAVHDATKPHWKYFWFD
ncbi:MAG: hypothetical protein SFU99_04590 [Saprospiraceae bacterium]|nr:hypothetical protein [Saprospiraceae bacterium]